MSVGRIKTTQRKENSDSILSFCEYFDGVSDLEMNWKKEI